MQDDNMTDYGPLVALVGTWSGNKGVDIAPETDGSEERNEYHETIVFTEADDLANAEEENLSAVHYVQKVKRISNDEVIHQVDTENGESGHHAQEHAVGEGGE